MTQLHDMRSPIRVEVKSGAHLEVSFQRDGAGFDKLRLTEPADLAFLELLIWINNRQACSRYLHGIGDPIQRWESR